MLNLASITNVLGILIFFTTKQGNYCKILKLDSHIRYEKRIFEFLGMTKYQFVSITTTLGY